MIVAANSADSAGNEVRVSRIFALHEDAVSAEDGGSAMTLGHFSIGKIYLCIDTEAADDPSDRIPIHLNKGGSATYLWRLPGL